MNGIANGFVTFVFINVIRLCIFRDKAPDGTIVGSLTLGGKETTRKLFHPPVISDTFTTLSLSIAGLVGACAPFLVLFEMTFKHGFYSFPY